MKLHMLCLHPKDAANCLTSQPGQGKYILRVPCSLHNYKGSWADACRCRYSRERCLVGMDAAPPTPGQAEKGLEP